MVPYSENNVIHLQFLEESDELDQTNNLATLNILLTTPYYLIYLTPLAESTCIPLGPYYFWWAVGLAHQEALKATLHTLHNIVEIFDQNRNGILMTLKKRQ